MRKRPYLPVVPATSRSGPCPVMRSPATWDGEGFGRGPPDRRLDGQQQEKDPGQWSEELSLHRRVQSFTSVWLSNCVWVPRDGNGGVTVATVSGHGVKDGEEFAHAGCDGLLSWVFHRCTGDFLAWISYPGGSTRFHIAASCHLDVPLWFALWRHGRWSRTFRLLHWLVAESWGRAVGGANCRPGSRPGNG